MRRIRSIALVHETLSRAPGEEVVFDEIVRPLVRMVQDGLLSDERPVGVDVSGEAGELPAQVATPLAVILTELLQNAVGHAFPDDASSQGAVEVQLVNNGDQLVVVVHDNGVGLPEDFELATSSGLGLTIVRALVTSELSGTIEMRTDHGTVVELRIPLKTVAVG